MSAIELTESQTDILQELVDLHRESEDAVKGEAIAEKCDRNPGTIRNQMQSLKALQLVEGIPGPKGGYKPTAQAYDALDVQEIDQAAEVPLFREGERVPDVTVTEIDLASVHHPDLCRAEVHVQGPVREFHDDDDVTVGPTPRSRLVVEGVVDGKDETNRVLVVDIDHMEAPADDE